HHGSGIIEMLAVLDRSALPDQSCQFRLAFDERQVGEIAPIEVEEIEHVIDEAVALSRLERGLQRRKAGDPALVLDHDLAVEQRRVGGKRGDGMGDVGKFFVPMEALAGEQTGLAIVEPRLNAIAVELDLVDPAGAGWRLGPQGGERRRHEFRQWRPARASLRFFLPALGRSRLGCRRGTSRAARALARGRTRRAARGAAAGRPYVLGWTLVR